MATLTKRDGGDGRPESIDDVAYLTRAAHRVAVLEALAERPRSRDELRELTGISRSTMGRTLREFEGRRWVRRNGPRYEATQPGAFVARAMTALFDRLETERTLRDVWQYLPLESADLGVESVADAVVTVAESEDPYAPINRFRSLLEGTDRFRFLGFDLAVLEPCRDVLRRQIVTGMETEIVEPPGVAGYLHGTYPDHCAGPVESGNLVVLVHAALPSYGLCLFDDRTAVCGHDPDSGTVQVLLDTDDPAVREWATETYECYRREARPLALESSLE